MQFLLK